MKLNSLNISVFFFITELHMDRIPSFGQGFLVLGETQIVVLEIAAERAEGSLAGMKVSGGFRYNGKGSAYS